MRARSPDYIVKSAIFKVWVISATSMHEIILYVIDMHKNRFFYTLGPIWKSDLHCPPDSTTSETASYTAVINRWPLQRKELLVKQTNRALARMTSFCCMCTGGGGGKTGFPSVYFLPCSILFFLLKYNFYPAIYFLPSCSIYFTLVWVLPNVGGWDGWFPNNVQTPHNHPEKFRFWPEFHLSFS